MRQLIVRAAMRRHRHGGGGAGGVAASAHRHGGRGPLSEAAVDPGDERGVYGLSDGDEIVSPDRRLVLRLGGGQHWLSVMSRLAPPARRR
eukprot:COSAG01_NODE_4664_length_4838_cov_5.744461_4_plen_90_part_00